MDDNLTLDSFEEVIFDGQMSDGITEYRGLKLDEFQIEAIAHLDAGHSVLISAPTGVGKTLVADYLIEKTYKSNKRVIYTAPIKALSNQKFKEFKRLLGEDNVGIITGDIVINSAAPVLIMTTEIFRNMLHLDSRGLEGVSHVIFDEIHFLSDEDRGAVWEESIIFMPEDMRLLGLSATIPNVDELAFWISDIKKHEVAVVTNFKRVVPLRHYYFEKQNGECTLDDLKKYKVEREKAVQIAIEENPWVDIKQLAPKATNHVELVTYLSENNRLPCLYFVFSRRQCEEKAEELAKNLSFLEAYESRDILEYFDAKILGLKVEEMPSVMQMRRIIQKGIAYHHAGLLPVLKEIVEDLFERKLLHVLYATETFAVGLNFPVRTVCFDTVRKFNGYDFRPMSGQEYFQMAGRSGRRGIDEVGYVYILVDMNYFRPDEFPNTDETKVEPLVSRFSLSYNTVINLISTRSKEEIDQVLKMNFAIYQSNAVRKDLDKRLKTARNTERISEQELCSDTGKLSCPLFIGELNDKMAHLKAELKRAQKRRRNGEKRALLRAEIEELRRFISKGNGRNRKNCSRDKRRECKKAIEKHNIIVAQVKNLYGRVKNLTSDDKFILEFERKRSLLERLSYLSGDSLLPRGEIAKSIHTQELLVTEIIFSGLLNELDSDQLAALAVCIDYEPRRGEFPSRVVPFDMNKINLLIEEISFEEESYMGNSTINFFTGITMLAYKWSQGEEFSDIMKDSNYAEGDIVSSFRRSIDLLRQMRAACGEDKLLVSKITSTISKIDRGVVEVLI